MSGSYKISARNKLIVALDVPNASDASRLAKQLRGHVGMFKVGLELFCAEGLSLVRNMIAGSDKVFLDLKFHDIPNTVRAAAREAGRLGVTMFNVHATGGRKMMEAALEGAREVSESLGKPRSLVLSVTVLTSLGSEDVREIGFSGSTEESVVRLARLAQEAGLDGVVASALEIASIRRACGRDFVIVTPGIRPVHAPDAAASRAKPDDQARIATPNSAIHSGADYLVVGRPITQAPDPATAADAIVNEVGKALESSLA